MIAESCFGHFDKNHDGEIDRAELRQVCIGVRRHS
jgi:Ca2+-binding EF-hand superfamily protein